MLMVIFLLYLHFITITFPTKGAPLLRTKLCLHHFNASYYNRGHDLSADVDMRVSINKMYYKLLDATTNFAY